MTTSITVADVDRFHALMQEEEQSEDPETPLEIFTEDAMWFHLGNAAAATARGGDSNYAYTDLSREPS